jgi:hypothetical protein
MVKAYPGEDPVPLEASIAHRMTDVEPVLFDFAGTLFMPRAPSELVLESGPRAGLRVSDKIAAPAADDPGHVLALSPRRRGDR